MRWCLSSMAAGWKNGCQRRQTWSGHIPRRQRTRGHTVRAAFDEQCPSNHFQNRPRYRPVDDRQRTVRDRLIEDCRLQTARTALSGCRAGRTTLSPRRGDRRDVLGWMWKLFQGMTVLWRCMLLASWTHLTVDLPNKKNIRLLTVFNSSEVILKLSVGISSAECGQRVGSRKIERLTGVWTK